MAATLRRRQGRWATGTTTTHHGYCLKCQARCGVLAEVTDGALSAVRDDPAHPNGGICAMGAAEVEVTASPRRLTRPLRRTNAEDEPPRWEEIFWDDALTEVVDRISGDGGRSRSSNGTRGRPPPTGCSPGSASASNPRTRPMTVVVVVDDRIPEGAVVGQAG